MPLTKAHAKMPTYERPSWIDEQYRTLPPLSREEEAWLIPMAQAGDEVAADRVIRANVRFAVQLCAWWARKYRLPFADLVPVAVSGLWYGLTSFDPSKGFKFISYAVWWVRQRLDEEGAEMKNIVRRPLHTRQADIRFHRAMVAMEQQAGRFVDEGEVLAQADLSKGYVSPPAVFSLDRPIETDGDGETRSTFHDVMASHDGEAEVFDALSRDELRRRLGRYLAPEGWNVAGLSQRDREILRRSFGWDGGEPETLDAIGQTMGISRERVRQRRALSLEAIRKHINGHRAEIMELVEV